MKTHSWTHHAQSVARILLGGWLLLAPVVPSSQPVLAMANEPQLLITDDFRGLFPQFELLDPTPGLEDRFGDQVIVLANGNVVVTDPYDDAAAPDAGAVHLFDGLTGELISTLTGASANDHVGSGGVEALSNGNFLVVSYEWDNGSTPDAGAVTWGDGLTGITGAVSMANSIVGEKSNDVGLRGGVLPLAGGNYLILSPLWDNGDLPDVGAVTWGNGSSGAVGVISVNNSLIGAQANDRIGGGDAIALTNGNYVVSSPDWDNGLIADVGAVTWGNGATGLTGVVSAQNSLIGSTAGDIGNKDHRLAALPNGNYLLVTPVWDNGEAANVGAVTWGNGAEGIAGAISPANSLVGLTANDVVGSGNVTILQNGNYVVNSPHVYVAGAANAGAVTWGNGASGSVGGVSAANSLVGSSPDDLVGAGGVVALTNDNYVVISYFWDNDKGAATDAGAVTWGSGTTGVKGLVSPENSLVGAANSLAGIGGVTPLPNGNYVVASPNWGNGTTPTVGAVTWGHGSRGIAGAISVENSLVGEQLGDNVGSSVVALTNGNYVVLSPGWDNRDLRNAGAATWASGSGGGIGYVSATNSLIGTDDNDAVGSRATALSNGNYVVSSPTWNHRGIRSAGAATWGNGETGIIGVITGANSLVGAQENDYVGESVTPLRNGNYVVSSPYWNNGNVIDAGAATWANGGTALAGAITQANSFVGLQPYDSIGGPPELPLADNPKMASGDAVSTVGADQRASNVTVVDTQISDGRAYGITELSDGSYLVNSPLWDNGALPDAGAATWLDANSGQSLDRQSYVTAQNSLIGAADKGILTTVQENPVHGTIVVTIHGGKRARLFVGFVDPNQLSYQRGQQQSIRIQSALVTRALNRGEAVTLQTNNDFTLDAQLQANRNEGQVGALSVQAGRGLTLNGSMLTNGGALTLIANDTLANGVVDSARGPGAATIIMTSTARIDTGAGELNIELRNGAGKSYAENGSIHLQQIRAGSVTVSNSGSSPNSDIALHGAVNSTGAQEYHTPNGLTTVAAGLTTSNAPIRFANSVVINPAVSLNSGSNAVEFIGANVQTLQATGAGLPSLAHTGDGTLRLLGSTTIGGTLHNMAGTFDANGQMVTVQGAAFFQGGSYRPDIALQSFAGDLTLQAGATLRVDLNGPVGQYSQLQVGGVVDVTESTLQVVTGFSPGLSSRFTIIDNDSNSPVVGAFAGLPQGATLLAGGLAFEINYQGGDGNDVVLTVVPAPVVTPTATATPPVTVTPPATTPPPTVTPPLTPIPPGQNKIYLPVATD